jgi:hypothetical protein
MDADFSPDPPLWLRDGFGMGSLWVPGIREANTNPTGKQYGLKGYHWSYT